MKKLDVPVDNYPELIAYKIKSSAMYFIYRTTKKPDHADFMSLDKVENLFYGEKLMLAILVKEVYKKNKNHALGLCIRNQLTVQDF
jgi:hypothetical protein